MNIKHWILPAALALAVATAQAVQCATAPEVVRGFFQEDYSFAFESPDKLHTAVTPQFRKLLKLESDCKMSGDSCAIDWDPWTGAQDGDITGPPSIKLLSESPNQAEVELVVLLKDGEKASSKRTTLVLARQLKTGCWELADVMLDGRDSVRRLLSHAASSPDASERPR